MLTSSEQDQLAGVAGMILRMLHHGAFRELLAEGGAMPAGDWLYYIVQNFSSQMVFVHSLFSRKQLL